MATITVEVPDDLAQVDAASARSLAESIDEKVQELQRIQSGLTAIAEEVEQIARIQAEAKAAKGVESAESGLPFEVPTTPDGAYMVGDTVEGSDGSIYRSRIPYNVWDPLTSPTLWERVTDEPLDPTIPVPWEEGLTATRGFLVEQYGVVYRSKISHVTHYGWAPSEFTHAVWEVVEISPAPDPYPDPETPPEDPPPGSEEDIPEWAAGMNVIVGTQVIHDGYVWEAKLAHTTHVDWVPSDAAHAVWKKIRQV